MSSGNTIEKEHDIYLTPSDSLLTNKTSDNEVKSKSFKRTMAIGTLLALIGLAGYIGTKKNQYHLTSNMNLGQADEPSDALSQYL